MRNYKECDELTEQISKFKSQKRELDVELSALNKKQKKSVWYAKKKNSSTSESLGKSSRAMKSNLSSSKTDLSSSKHPRSSSVSSRSISALSDSFSSVSGNENSDDTVILSDDESSEPLHIAAKPTVLKRSRRISEVTSDSEAQYFQ